MKSRQSGLSLIGMLLVAALLGCALLVGFKTVGPYKEYFAVKHIIGRVADEGNKGALESEMRKSFDYQAIVDSIEVKSGDLAIRKEGGRYVVEVEYTRKAPLVGNVSLAFDFKATSRK
ncbi:MAG: DUF4845 domain-containing protein [Azoarcus sp.]|jgi:hypothetical protein|nr:DUF4845 domain-containing protein [Azoarcus sp.]